MGLNIIVWLVITNLNNLINESQVYQYSNDLPTRSPYNRTIFGQYGIICYYFIILIDFIYPGALIITIMLSIIFSHTKLKFYLNRIQNQSKYFLALLNFFLFNHVKEQRRISFGR